MASFGSCIAALFLLVIAGYPMWRIFEKAGYPGPASLLMYVPIVNLIVIWYAALNEWPVERRAKGYVGSGGFMPPPPPGQI